MSYILEALKKAQAERQLGNAPTIHAPPPVYAAPERAQGANRRTLMIGLGLGALLVAAAALLWLRQGGEQPVPLAATTAPSPVAAPAPAPAPAPVAVAPPAAPAPVPTPEPAPVQREAAPVAAQPAPAPVKASEPPRPAAPAAPVRASPEPAPVAAAPAGDDGLRSLQQLPEAVRREIPQVVFGGYIYSPTPGESLLLVDKMLRREGEEVAPGLVLERLTPKAAVMNYRGTRYRVAY